MNKAFLYGIFLYEGFVSKRSPQRNKKSKEHFNELQLYLNVIAFLQKNNFDDSDKNLFQEMYSFLTGYAIGKYYPYTIQEVEKAQEINFLGYEGIPQDLWDNPNYFIIISIMEKIVKKNQKILETSFSFFKKNKMLHNFNSIHNLPRLLFPNQTPNTELPFLGLKLNEFEIPNI
jgi:hypothetical protein